MVCSIEQMEIRFQEAQRTNNIGILNELMDDDLLFIDLSGKLLNKEANLKIYQSFNSNNDYFISGSPLIEIKENIAHVSIIIEHWDFFNNQTLSGKFLYLRIWKNVSGQWKVVAGSAIQLES